MSSHFQSAVAAFGALAAVCGSALAAAPLSRVGDCQVLTVTDVGSRLQGAPDSGSAIAYSMSKQQVAYETIPGVEHSKKGDQVRLCVSELPKKCPPGDHRGVIYSARNLRTLEKWKAADSEHSCGGA